MEEMRLADISVEESSGWHSPENILAKPIMFQYNVVGFGPPDTIL